MKECTINGVTYIPVIHKKRKIGKSKCRDCIANTYPKDLSEKEHDNRINLCVKLPDCYDNKHTCHFVVKEN